MLENHVFLELRRKRRIRQVVFQQDGAHPYHSQVATRYLKSILPENQIIARGFSQHWPARSPDLSPLDYYFWAVIKFCVYFNFRLETLAQLRV